MVHDEAGPGERLGEGDPGLAGSRGGGDSRRVGKAPDCDARPGGGVRAGEARLVRRARDGDARAFELLVRRHLGSAYAVALAVLGAPADAEDACQDAFVTALERLEECRSPERFAAWLHQIVRNRARDLLRQAAARRSVSLDAAAGLAGPESPVADAERAELRERLVDSMTALGEVRREVLLLHDLEGWRHAEIADLMGLPEGTVRAHLFHARRALRARLGADLPQGT